MIWTDSNYGVSPLCYFLLHLLISRQLSVPGNTGPYAISLVKNYRAFFILNALFALTDCRVTTIRFLFASVFVNFLQYIEDEWTLLIDCIAKGIIPDMENLEHVREPLEAVFTLILHFIQLTVCLRNTLLQTLFVLPSFAKLDLLVSRARQSVCGLT